MNEPLSKAEAVRAVLIAVLAVLQVFDVIHLSDEQNGAVLALYVAVSVALTAFSRAKVTPTSQVALTHDDVTLLNAGGAGHGRVTNEPADHPLDTPPTAP